jgi:hypothetical protein
MFKNKKGVGSVRLISQQSDAMDEKSMDLSIIHFVAW